MRAFCRKLLERALGPALLVLALYSGEAQAQQYGTRLGFQQGEVSRALAQSPEILMNAVDPAVRRWYITQELYSGHRWRQWNYTNYARARYERYVETDIEGDYFYDLFGNYLTQGWLIFNTEQRRPQEAGSTLFKTQRFSQWFNEVVIAGDRKGQYHYSLTASNGLRTVFTPLVLSKPQLNGVQFDLATDKYRATLVHSLVSGPRGVQQAERAFTNATSMVGGRFTAQCATSSRCWSTPAPGLRPAPPGRLRRLNYA